MGGVGDGVTDLHLVSRLHIGYDVAHIACEELIALGHAGGEDADLFDLIGFGGMKELDAGASFHAARHDTHIGNHTAERIVNGIEYGGAQQLVLILDGRGDALNDSFEYFLNTDAVFCGSWNSFVRRDANDVL